MSSAGGVSVADEEPMPTEDPRLRQKSDVVETGSASPFKPDDYKGVLPQKPKNPAFEEVMAWGANGAFHKSVAYSPEESLAFFLAMRERGWTDGDGSPLVRWRNYMPVWCEGQREKKAAKDKASAATERYAQLFERFWNEYPKHENMMGAEQAFAAVMDGCKSDGERSALVEEMLDAIATLKGTKWANPDDDKFIPMPANWLKSRRWTDEGIVNSDEAIHRRLEEHARKLNLENERYSFRNCHGAVLSDGSVIP